MTTTPQRYRKKPVEITAMRFDGDNADVIVQWIDREDGRHTPAAWDPASGVLSIGTLEGNMRVSVGDYVIRGVQGEYYPCKPRIFRATYEAVSDE